MLQDEVFHIPQTQRYCRGKFTHWDSKITTLPGTYVLAAAYARSLSAVLGEVRYYILARFLQLCAILQTEMCA